MIWRKLTANSKPRMGTGYRVRTLHEPILVATIGNPKHKPLPSLFDGVAREHSRKPDEFHNMVLRHTLAPMCRADLFSRETRPAEGWGLEHGKFDGEPVDANASNRRRVCATNGSGRTSPLLIRCACDDGSVVEVVVKFSGFCDQQQKLLSGILEKMFGHLPCNI
jgi:hypothetical protein